MNNRYPAPPERFDHHVDVVQYAIPAASMNGQCVCVQMVRRLTVRRGKHAVDDLVQRWKAGFRPGISPSLHDQKQNRSRPRIGTLQPLLDAHNSCPEQIERIGGWYGLSAPYL